VNALLSYSIVKLEMFPDKLSVVATERLPHFGWPYEELGRVQGVHFISYSVNTKEMP